ncbi:DUF433 domain-containing protein [Bdellovibrionota bacterium FG-1]
MCADTKTLSSYVWVVVDPDLLGGQPTVKGTRLSVAHILACMSEGMTAQDIARDYPGFPPESLPEVLKFASDHMDKCGSDDVAA